RRNKKSSSSRKKKNVGLLDKEETGLSALLQHKSAHNEAILWLSRTYATSGKYEEAESILDLIEVDENLTQSFKGKIALEKSFLALKTEDERLAVENLDSVSEDANMPDWLRARASYLAGQLYEEQEQYASATKSFEKVSDF